MVQLIFNRERQHVQQLFITLVFTTIHVNTSLPTFVPRGFSLQPSNEGQPRDSHGRSSPIGNPLGGPPFNPPIGSYGWPTPNLHMFIPPWC
jgi:hypothetical protein